MNSQAEKKTSESMPFTLSVSEKSSLIVCLSPLPQYCAPSIAPAPVTAYMNIFCMNCICDASDTAVISFCSTLPSISASHAATSASIRLCSDIGRARVKSFL